MRSKSSERLGCLVQHFQVYIDLEISHFSHHQTQASYIFSYIHIHQVDFDLHRSLPFTRSKCTRRLSSQLPSLASLLRSHSFSAPKAPPSPSLPSTPVVTSKTPASTQAVSVSGSESQHPHTAPASSVPAQTVSPSTCFLFRSAFIFVTLIVPKKKM